MRKKLLLLISIVLVLALGLVFVLRSAGSNRAADIAKPLEVGFEKAGGVKKSSSGDGGRSIDNSEPYYDAIFELPVSKDDAVSVATRVAAENGYKLVHAAPGNKGPLESLVSDKNIDSWYFDDSSKMSNFADLETGPVRLSIQVGDSASTQSSAPTTVRISVRLPVTKR